jgi:signal transduction histidine kinase
VAKLSWTKESNRGHGSARALPASLLQDLERQARRVRWLLVGFVMAVAVLPSTFFIIWEVDHLRRYARHDAREIGNALVTRLAQSGPDAEALSTWLPAQMKEEDITFLRLVSASSGRTLDFGDPTRPILPVTITIPLPSSAAPFKALQVIPDDRPLKRAAGVVFGIHLLIAGFLALMLYRLPMRALYLAVSEAKDRYAQLIHADRLSAIGEMYASLAHEINNPLGIILSRVRLLLGTAKERTFSADLVRDLEMIDRHGSRIAVIIRSLLAFSRKTSFESTDTDLNRVVTDVVSLVEQPFTKHGVRIGRLLEPALPVLRGSPDHLQQVFLNLFNNGRDAMPNGGTITVKTYRDGAWVVAEVQDTGAGIAPDIRGRIFEPFFTTKEVSNGTGLGLSVSYGIVKAHGGNIEVESSPGSGALFRVTLPIRGEP